MPSVRRYQDDIGSEAAGGDAEPAEQRDSRTGENTAEPRYVHGLNKGGLEEILATGRLNSSEAAMIAGGVPRVNALRGDFGSLHETMNWHDPEKIFIEFTTEVEPPYHPAYARWSGLENDYLPIAVTGVFDGSGRRLDAAGAESSRQTPPRLEQGRDGSLEIYQQELEHMGIEIAPAVLARAFPAQEPHSEVAAPDEANPDEPGERARPAPDDGGER
ncbi:MAG: hypothetical protein K2Z25_25745 [Beijerinckiaceae bacterium]|nr:hypothetical protein [Beijerinckiaceae bacterium]